VSAGEYRRYLDQRASVWERLALIRARHVAGTARFGSEVMKSVESFVFGKPLSKREIERIMEIRKSMIAASQKRHSGSINVKSGAGGITDIDFIAQTYAIHYGTENLALRRRETTALLKALGNTKLMETGDATTLGELHSFLCDVEKALRIGSGRSINTLPSSESETNRVSRLLGFRNSRRFRKRLDDSTALVSELYDRLMTDLSKRAPDDISGK